MMQTLMLCFVDGQVSLKRQLFAMWNVAGLDDARALFNMIHSNNLQHVSLQETRLNDSGQRRFQTLAAEYGYDTFFTRPENDAAGLITDGLVTLTRFDAQIVNIPGVDAYKVIVVQVPRFNGTKCLCANIHIPGAWTVAKKDDSLSKLVCYADSKGAKMLIHGDWNLTVDQVPLSFFLCQGELEVHDTFQEIATPTRMK